MGSVFAYGESVAHESSLTETDVNRAVAEGRRNRTR